MTEPMRKLQPSLLSLKSSKSIIFRGPFHFKPVVLPNKWQKTARAASQGNVSPKGEAYKDYFPEAD